MMRPTQTASMIIASLFYVAAFGVNLSHAADDKKTVATKPPKLLPAIPNNPNIDSIGFLKISREAMMQRETHRISEADFLKMSREPGTILLDARSEKKYRELHVAGAKNLNFSDITAENLAAMIPNKTTRILIYCNNNFSNAPAAFPSKLPSASLNLSTFTALYNYGYRNVYELAPFVDANTTKLSLISATL